MKQFFSDIPRARRVLSLWATLVTGVCFVVASCSIVAQAATPSACYNITDSDARSYCIAKARRDVSQCYNIVRSDMRSMCLAEVGR